jgi:hypothetical protein
VKVLDGERDRPWAAPHRVHTSDDGPAAIHGTVFVFQQLVIVAFDDGRIECKIVVHRGAP